MSETFEELRNAALALLPEERAWLAESLWRSLRTAEERAIDDEWDAVAEERMAEIEAGTAVTISGEELIARARAALNASRPDPSRD